MEFEGNVPCQSFTALGYVSGEMVYHFDMGNSFVPFRRDVRYIQAKDATIAPLLQNLSFIKDKQRWGYPFRFGLFEISESDFELIAVHMRIKEEEII